LAVMSSDSPHSGKPPTPGGGPGGRRDGRGGPPRGGPRDARKGFGRDRPASGRAASEHGLLAVLHELERPLTTGDFEAQKGHLGMLLEKVKPYDRAPSAEFWAPYLRGQAHLMLKDGRAAAGEFQSILSRRGEVPTSMLYPLSHLGTARAAMLINDSDLARRGYEEFLALWTDADSALHPLKEARLEYSRLR